MYYKISGKCVYAVDVNVPAELYVKFAERASYCLVQTRIGATTSGVNYYKA